MHSDFRMHYVCTERSKQVPTCAISSSLECTRSIPLQILESLPGFCFKHERVGAFGVLGAQISALVPAGEVIRHPRNALADPFGADIPLALTVSTSRLKADALQNAQREHGVGVQPDSSKGPAKDIDRSVVSHPMAD